MCFFSKSKHSNRAKARNRKPKFLSLRRHLSHLPPPPPPLPDPSPMPPIDHDRDHPVVSLLDSAASDAGGADLAALLGSAASDPPSEAASSTPSSSSMTWDPVIARRALRGRAAEQEACSAGAGEVDLWCGAAAPPARGLALKLDYEEVMTAWSDKGSLFIEGDAAGYQVVPQVYPTLVCDGAQPPVTVFVDVGCCNGNVGGLWRVPEVCEKREAEHKDHMEEEGKASSNNSSSKNREERVRRYKEKRQNRLFSKRIRYEVRKLNAEKRPRMKGRFVKRNDDADV